MPKGYRHGLKGTPEYETWVRMRQRCLNPNSPDYSYYGARGISICERWDSPVLFVQDMGKRPSKHHELDRIDNNGNYCPENCRWVEKTPQMRNTRLSKIWYVNDIRYESLGHAAEVLNATPTMVKRWCEGRDDKNGYVYPPKLNCWSEKRYES